MTAASENILKQFPAELTALPPVGPYPACRIAPEHLKTVCRRLQNEPSLGFNMLMDLTCVDYLFWEERDFRFELVYNLYSSALNQRLLLKAPVAEKDAVVESVTDIWPAADWFEREVFDMFGVSFKGHPNLKRILMYEGFNGHALRKDYPYNKRQPIIGPLN